MFNLHYFLKKIYAAVCARICGEKQRVLFISFSGKSYSDNPRAISETLHGLDENVEIYWAFLHPVEKKAIVPSYVHVINRTNFVEFYRVLGTAKVVVNNFAFLEPKVKGQYFIQTWHGDRAFKKVLYDANPIRKRPIYESVDGFCDLMVAGSEYGVRQMRTAFRYKGEILKVGTPRDDLLVKGYDSKVKKIKSKLGIMEDIRVLLYAPTLRDNNLHGQHEIQDLDLKRTLQVLEEKEHLKWLCLLRAHPAMAGLSGVEKNDKIMDVSRYEDMTDLLLVSDLLITDYSSCAGDFALMHKPIILFQSDRQQYMEQSRDFYFDMKDSPYLIAESQQELEALIGRLDEEVASKNCDEILRFYGTFESGKAAETIARKILEWISK